MESSPASFGRASRGRVWHWLFGNLPPGQVAWRLIVDMVALNLGLGFGIVAWVLLRASTLPSLPAYLLPHEIRYQYFVHAPTYNVMALLSLVTLRAYTHLPRQTALRVLAGPFRVAAVGLLGHTAVVYLVYQKTFPMRGAVVLAWGLGLFFMVLLRSVKYWATRRYLLVRRRGSARGKVENVLVIGGAGFIGSALVGRLLESGYQVRVLDQLIFGEGPIHDFRSQRRFELIEGDFRDVAMVVRAVRGVDAVVHLGAIVGDPACALDDEMTLEINYAATQMIREVCRGAGISRFIFASTCSVYGASDGPIHEESRLNPVSLYARSKIASERALLDDRVEDFSPTVLRLATVFGLSPRPRFDLVANLLAAQAQTSGQIQIFNGDQWRPFIHVRDVARAMVACLEAPLEAVGGRVLNVGDNSMNFTLKQLAETVARVIPGTDVRYVDRVEDRRNYRVQFDRIERTLGFHCTLRLEDGVREVVEALRSGAVQNFRDPLYDNAAFLRGLTEETGFRRHGVLGPWARSLAVDEPEQIGGV